MKLSGILEVYFTVYMTCKSYYAYDKFNFMVTNYYGPIWVQKPSF